MSSLRKEQPSADALSRNPVTVSQVLLFQSATRHDYSLDDVTTGTNETDSPKRAPESDIGHLQHQDPQLSLWFDYLENGRLPTDNHTARRLVLEQDQFQLVDGILYCITPSAPDQWGLVVPESLKMTLMKEDHSGKFAGHFAERKLHATLSHHYW